ncbi:MAG: hypothetical protein WCF90_07760 [Methanomicrobiales archaeon]
MHEGYGVCPLSLVEKAGVAAVMGSSFYHEGGETKFRFTLSKKDEALNEA